MFPFCLLLCVMLQVDTCIPAAASELFLYDCREGCRDPARQGVGIPFHIPASSSFEVST
jgi:hypothetical protein